MMKLTLKNLIIDDINRKLFTGLHWTASSHHPCVFMNLHSQRLHPEAFFLLIVIRFSFSHIVFIAFLHVRVLPSGVA